MISEITSQPTRERTQANASSDTLSYSTSECVLGQVLAARSVKGVCGILIGAGQGELEVDLASCFPNPIALAVPRHRVVRRSGDLAGYRWGIERKREPIGREAMA
jgi:hypothetical protein